MATDLELPEKAARRVIDRVVSAVPGLAAAVADGLDLPQAWMRDLQRVMRKRARDLEGG